MMKAEHFDDLETVNLDSSISTQSNDKSTYSSAYHSFQDPLLNSQGNQKFTIDEDDDSDEPPSYSEALSSPFINDPISQGRNAKLVSFRLSTSFDSTHSQNEFNRNEYLKITVTDPEKQVGLSSSIMPGGATYTDYLITTETNLPEFETGKFSVRRRFRDIVMLSDRLLENYKGYFIPNRPDKSVFESQVMNEKEFIEMRIATLQKYLSQLSNHPIIKRSDILIKFLKSNDPSPLSSIYNPSASLSISDHQPPSPSTPSSPSSPSSISSFPPETNPPPSKSSSSTFYKLFRGFTNTLTSELGLKKVTLVEEEKSFLEKKEKVTLLGKNLAEASKQGEDLIKAEEDLQKVMANLGLNFMKFSTFEEKSMQNFQIQFSKNARHFGNGVLTFSRFMHGKVNDVIKYLTPLHDHLALTLVMNSAFSDRSQTLLTLQNLKNDLNLKKERLRKLEDASKKVFGENFSGNKKILNVQNEILDLEKSLLAAEKEYEQIKERNALELDRVEKERKDDFQIMLKGFIKTQVDFFEKSESEWKKIGEGLNSI